MVVFSYSGSQTEVLNNSFFRKELFLILKTKVNEKIRPSKKVQELFNSNVCLSTLV